MIEKPPGQPLVQQPIVVRGDDGRSYRIVEKLGQGGFGNVYRAWVEDDSGVSRQVAVKVLKEEVPEEVVIRFRDEARMLGLVYHRAIVGLHGLVDFDGQLAAILEFVPGIDLKSLIEHEPPPLRVAVRLVEEVASALHAAYAQPNELTGRPLRLIHRDIKPANIRVTPGGEVRVVDFGGARADFASREAQTRSFVVGSYRYMAPERLDLVDSPRSDVYSLGLVLAELLVGHEVPTPSKHHGQHDGFVEAVREAVEGRMHREGLPLETSQRLLGLLDGMLDYYPQHRPTGREVELQARALLHTLPGPFLREWAEEVVPALERARRSEATPIASRRAVFPESADSAAEPALVAPAHHWRARPEDSTTVESSAVDQPAVALVRREASAVKLPLGLVLAVLFLFGLLVPSVITNQLRNVERLEPEDPVFRPVAPLPPLARDWGPIARPLVPAAPSARSFPTEAGPATADAPPTTAADPEEKRGLFRLGKKKKQGP